MTIKSFFLFAAMITALAAAGSAQTAEDKAEIRKTVLNYAEGWYEGDAAKMESALRPRLAKRTVRTTGPRGRSNLQELSALGLVQVTRPGYGKKTPAADRQKDIRILDVYKDMATVRLEMQGWIDYMHVGRFNGKWVIINVLWKAKPAKREKED